LAKKDLDFEKILGLSGKMLGLSGKMLGISLTKKLGILKKRNA